MTDPLGSKKTSSSKSHVLAPALFSITIATSLFVMPVVYHHIQFPYDTSVRYCSSRRKDKHQDSPSMNRHSSIVDRKAEKTGRNDMDGYYHHYH